MNMIVKEMKKISAVIASVSYFASSSLALAQAPAGEGTKTVGNINLNNIQTQGIVASTPIDTLLKNAFTIVFAVAALTVLVFLIYGAFKWITSGGEKEGTKAARTYITNALVGLAILALAFVILRVVGDLVGFDVLTGFVIPALGPSAQK